MLQYEVLRRHKISKLQWDIRKFVSSLTLTLVMSMMKNIAKIFAIAVASSFVVSVTAADLIDVYKQALVSDPAFKQAKAEWLAQRENLPISRASLLPQLSATGSVGRSYDNVEGGYSGEGSSRFYKNTSSFSLSLTQPIFNFSSWASVREAGASVKQAEAGFAAASEDLLLRVASAYFAVLQSQDVLRFTREQKKAVGEQLRQQKQRYEVGLIPITDVNDAQASYDSVVAQEIAAKNDLQDQEEKLQEITNVKYSGLNTLQGNLPLVRPSPENIEKWVSTAEQQNYDLLAARYAAIAARENVSVQEGGHLPTLNVSGGYDYGYNSNANGSNHLSRDKSLSGGVSVNIPIFQGGAVSAQTQQSGYLYQKAVATQEKVHRSTVSSTRQAYLGVISGISKIKADRQVVKSKMSSLVSRQNSYAAGLRTIVEVLQAQSDLYDAEKTYAIDQYNYLLQTLTLKSLAGILSVGDLEKINHWLEKSGKLLDTNMAATPQSSPRVAAPAVITAPKPTVVGQPETDSKSAVSSSAAVAAVHSSRNVAVTKGTSQALSVPVAKKVKQQLSLESSAGGAANPSKASPTTAPASATATAVNQASVATVAAAKSTVMPSTAIASSVSSVPAVTTLPEPGSAKVVVSEPLTTKDAVAVAAANKTSSSQPKHLTYAEKYLNHAKANHYTVELISSKNKQEVVNFAALNNLQHKTVLLTQNKAGETFYSLIYGDFANASQARFAAKKIGVAINADKNPDVLQFADLKK